MTKSSKPIHIRQLYLARNLRSRALFDALEKGSRGRVLDVGGGDFFATALARGIPFESWTTLEPSAAGALSIDDPRFRHVVGDGCRMEFADASFDTVLALQVLEHVFEPIAMVTEIGRVLRPGGHAFLLVPQTGTMHMAPHWHGNLSRFWIEQALVRGRLEALEVRPLGGFWSTIASRLVYFFLQSFRVEGMSSPECRRGPLFYLLWPFMALFALVAIPICLVFSLGDLSEEPNNHLVVARKREG
ncbi:MAG: class I SAM-dependent methyltransferase [Planctomycetota bacterium]